MSYVGANLFHTFLRSRLRGFTNQRSRMREVPRQSIRYPSYTASDTQILHRRAPVRACDSLFGRGHICRQRQRQPHACPSCSGHGNPLIVIVRKAALEVGLELENAAGAGKGKDTSGVIPVKRICRDRWVNGQRCSNSFYIPFIIRLIITSQCQAERLRIV